MKIAMVSHAFSEYALRLAVAVSERHEVSLFLFEPGVSRELPSAFILPKSASLSVEVFPSRQFVDPRWLMDARTIRGRIESFGADVVHVQEAPNDTLGMVTRTVRCPVVLTIHDPKPHSGLDSREGWRRSAWRRSLRRRAGAIIVHGEALRREESKSSYGARRQVFSAPLPPLGFKSDQQSKEPPSATFLFFGRMEAYKGLGTFVAAAKAVRHSCKAARFIVAGSGSELARWRDHLTPEEGFEVLDRFVRPEELEALFARCTCVVLPYDDATQSGVASLALGFERGVIASDVGALSELVRPGTNGLLVPPKSPRELSEAMLAVARSEELARSMAAGASMLGRTEITWASAATICERVYESLLRDHPAGPEARS